MPIYEYRCQVCGHQFEVLVQGSQQPECPECHTQKLEKQLSTFLPTGAPSSSGGSSCCSGGGCGCN